jgi:protocatechuate 3,4-dioxygenase alpha subunit
MTTPSQTVGPYLAIGLPWPDGPDVVPEGTENRIRIYGTVYDGEGAPIPDALIETWQADPDGRFGTDFRGFGRCPTDDDGAYEIFTVKPGLLGDAAAREHAAEHIVRLGRRRSHFRPVRGRRSGSRPRRARR